MPIENSFDEEFTGAVEELLTKLFGEDSVRQQARSASLCAPVWQAAADAGWFDAILDQDAGGLDLGVPVLGGLFQAVGRHLAPGPFRDHVMVVPMLYPLATPAVRTHLAAATRGEKIIVTLDPEASCQANAAPTLRDGTVCGRVELAAYAAEADAFIVVTRDTNNDERFIFVDKSAPGLTIRPQRSFDPVMSYASVAFDAVEIRPEHIFRSSSPGQAVSVDHIRAATRTMAANELAGLARHMLDEAVAYAKNRHQFGRPIGAFQPVQHILADMATNVLMLEAIASEAARRIGGVEPDNDFAAVAKGFASTTARQVAESSMQVHGGIAFTAELELHRWYLHILALQNLYGDERVLAQRVGRRLLAGTAQP